MYRRLALPEYRLCAARCADAAIARGASSVALCGEGVGDLPSGSRHPCTWPSNVHEHYWGYQMCERLAGGREDGSNPGIGDSQERCPRRNPPVRPRDCRSPTRRRPPAAGASADRRRRPSRTLARADDRHGPRALVARGPAIAQQRAVRGQAVRRCRPRLPFVVHPSTSLAPSLHTVATR